MVLVFMWGGRGCIGIGRWLFLIAGELGECRIQIIANDFVFLFLVEQVICKQ